MEIEIETPMASTFVGFASVVLPRLPIGGASDGLKAFLAVRLQKAEMGHNLTTCSPAMSCHGLGLHDVIQYV